MTSEVSDNLGLPYLMPAQAQKHVTHNEALRVLDAIVQIGVEDRDLSAPALSPAEGSRFIIADGASGDWLGRAGQIASWQDGAWVFYPPNEGWTAWIKDEDTLVVWSGTAWHQISATGAVSLPMLGINTSADTTNRLAVKSDASLFSHDDVTPGSGDHRHILNKSAAAKTCSFLFQDAFSGRAEVGLTGDDDLHCKVSPDGSAWYEAIRVDRATGRVWLPSTPWREKLTASTTFYARDDGNDLNDGRGDNSGGAFLTLQGAFDALCSRFDFGGKSVTLISRKANDTNAFAINQPWTGGGNLIIEGDTATPSNCRISRSSGNGPIRIVTSLAGQVTIKGFQLACSHAAALISHEGVGTVVVQSMDYNGQVASGAFIGMLAALRPSAFLRLSGSHTISGSGSCFLQASTGAYLELFAGPTITLTGTPNFSWATVVASQRSFVSVGGVTFSGAATGTRYSVSDLAEIYANGVTIPGDAAGSVGTAGFYV